MNPTVSIARSSAVDAVVPEEDPYSISVDVDLEETCWGCGLRVLVPPHASVFKCGWCGAITKQMAVKCNNKYLRWIRFRDRCFVCVVLVVMLFFICGGIWAVYPVIFSIGYFCGIFHFTLALILSISTISSFCLAAFRPASVQQIIIWGSYSMVGKGGLENYTFCHYCSKPKSPRTHHCRSCGTCILDMDHHCPFIGNCVGAANHRCFVMFLISAVTSILYVTIMTLFATIYIWPPVNLGTGNLLNGLSGTEFLFQALKERAIAILSSAVFLPAQGLVLVYLFISSVSVGIGLSVLLWQQLCYIYTGETYLSHLSAVGNEGMSNKDCQNLVRFFGCPFAAATYLPSFWKSRKIHTK
ncbi:protein S-acyltransferase 11 isoform X1 [Primulina huaijiensis]|uniref:protein S-acyltransferase 11 isoform X1 n=1 Tax=Primulina huaijiensis TaxID=1492673 RepID=UPI003CC74A53